MNKSIELSGGGGDGGRWVVVEITNVEYTYSRAPERRTESPRSWPAAWYGWPYHWFVAGS